MLKEFKNFIARGNVIDMAIGIIIGSAFTGIVKSLTNNLINPLIGIFLGRIDLSNIKFSVGSATFRLGAFLNSIISFLIIAFVVFILVKIINSVVKKEPKSTTNKSEVLLTEIRDLLKNKN